MRKLSVGSGSASGERMLGRRQSYFSCDFRYVSKYRLGLPNSVEFGYLDCAKLASVAELERVWYSIVTGKATL